MEALIADFPMEDLSCYIGSTDLFDNDKSKLVDTAFLEDDNFNTSLLDGDLFTELRPDSDDYEEKIEVLEPADLIEMQYEEIVTSNTSPNVVSVEKIRSKHNYSKSITSSFHKNGEKKIKITKSNGNCITIPYKLEDVKIIKFDELNSHKKKQKHSNFEITSEVELTEEEKNLLISNGIKLPLYHPLTKEMERQLKAVRRRIKNKISAQDSRKRKKEYLEQVEENLKLTMEERNRFLVENKELKNKYKTAQEKVALNYQQIKQSQIEKDDLRSALNKEIIAKKSLEQHLKKCRIENQKLKEELENLKKEQFNNLKPKCPAYLLVVILAVSIIVFPSLRHSLMEKYNKGEIKGGVTRTLLSNQEITDADIFDLLKTLLKDQENPVDHDILNMINDMENKNSNFVQENLNSEDFNSISKNIEQFLNINHRQIIEKDFFLNKTGFLEPDVDDIIDSLGNSPKRIKLADQNHLNINAPSSISIGDIIDSK